MCKKEAFLNVWMDGRYASLAVLTVQARQVVAFVLAVAAGSYQPEKVAGVKKKTRRKHTCACLRRGSGHAHRGVLKPRRWCLIFGGKQTHTHTHREQTAVTSPMALASRPGALVKDTATFIIHCRCRTRKHAGTHAWTHTRACTNTHTLTHAHGRIHRKTQKQTHM